MKNYYTSTFYCTQCGNQSIPIMRRIEHSHERGHLKKLYCIYCKTEVNCVEIKPFGNYTKEDFMLEFKSGNFLPNGTRADAELGLYLAKQKGLA